jgi:serine/threonine protein kinase
MAPEILYGKSYDGASVDLFAATIILFIMRSGIPPFNNALPSDMYYKLLMQGKHDFFWRIHKKMTGNDYSVEFKDLIERMLSFNPDERLKIEELQNHPWLKGEIST